MMKRLVLWCIPATLIVPALFIASCSELKDDLPPPVSGPVQVHEDGWGQSASASFHGRYLKGKNYIDTECQRCHGKMYDGGTSNVSCLTCHPAYPHSAQFPQGRHTAYLRGNLFPLQQCQVCHGVSYAGGTIVEEGCTGAGCHVDATGAVKSPEACNTCHGQFRASASDFLSFAPPKSVAGDTATTIAGVGAHQAHLQYGNAGVSIRCQECHSVPANWDDAGHVDTGSPAEVGFNDTLAVLVTGNGSYIPSNVSYDPSTLKCSNTYCHGNWRATRASSPNQFGYTDTIMVGNNASPVWIGGAAEATCGSCHGIPPTGHMPLPPPVPTSCAGCHPSVVDGAGNIIDKTKHVNGKINVFGSERPF